MKVCVHVYTDSAELGREVVYTHAFSCSMCVGGCGVWVMGRLGLSERLNFIFTNSQKSPFLPLAVSVGSSLLL